MVIPQAHWNASVTHEVQWIILVMEMCCRRYGACQSCFPSAFLEQLELVFPTIPLERIVLNGLGINILCSTLRVKKKVNYKLYLQSWDFLDSQSGMCKLSCEFLNYFLLLFCWVCSVCFKVLSITCTVNSKVLSTFPANLEDFSTHFPLISWDMWPGMQQPRCTLSRESIVCIQSFHNI